MQSSLRQESASVTQSRPDLWSLVASSSLSSFAWLDNSLLLGLNFTSSLLDLLQPLPGTQALDTIHTDMRKGILDPQKSRLKLYNFFYFSLILFFILFSMWG